MKFPTLIKRSRIILFNGVSRILSTLGTSIISLVVVRIHSAEIWGSALQSVLILDFAFSIIGWGSNPYLIREFSLEPRNISRYWSASTSARIPLLVAFLIVTLFLPLSTTLKTCMLVWALGRYLYQAYEPLLLYHKCFSFSLAVEITSQLVVLLPLFMMPGQATVEFVIGLMTAGMVLKAVLTTTFVFVRNLTRVLPSSTAELTGYYAAAFPFLLLTFSGMLQQRMDLYLVALYMNDKQTAIYQVFINWLIFCQFLASLLLSPFAKNIFRLPPESLWKMERNFMAWGILFAAASIFGVLAVMSLLYRFELNTLQYALGYCYILMTYLYLLRNYELGKMRKQTLAAVYSFAASLMNLFLSLYLTPRYGITGALLSATLSQVFLVILYRLKTEVYAPR